MTASLCGKFIQSLVSKSETALNAVSVSSSWLSKIETKFENWKEMTAFFSRGFATGPALLMQLCLCLYHLLHRAKKGRAGWGSAGQSRTAQGGQGRAGQDMAVQGRAV